MGVQLLRRPQDGDRRDGTQLAPLQVEPRAADHLPVRVHQHKILERRVQRPQVEEQLVVGAPVHRRAHRAAARRPRLPILVRQLLPAPAPGPAPVAGPGQGTLDLTPHAERDERERVAHNEETLEQQLLDPAVGHSGGAGRDEPVPQHRDLPFSEGCRHPHEGGGRRVEGVPLV